MTPRTEDLDGLSKAVARARANVALVKYWGKRDVGLNLPIAGSISLTLDRLSAVATVSRIAPRAAREAGRFRQGGIPVEGVAGERMAAFLDRVAREAGVEEPLLAEVEANFPVGAGLASSAAIYCAVAAAALSIYGAKRSRGELSAIARLGSGSAARSAFGGFVEWRRGERPDGRDSTAVQLLRESEWDVAMAVAITSEEKKRVASRDAMTHVSATSPLFAGWADSLDADLDAMRAAVAARDLESVGRIAEENCLRMHATCLAARPPVIFWSPTTLALIECAAGLRREGVPAYFTIDAGPQVKVLCRGFDLERVAAALAAEPGVIRVLAARPGPGVEILEGEAPWS